MPFNSYRNGYQNEDDFVKHLNAKRFNEINYSLQLFIIDIYGTVPSDSFIECYKNSELQKFDILIRINDVVKRISIKKGIKNSVHSEPISEFIHFLIMNKMPKEMVTNFLKYHYADGSTNGSGNKRISISEYKELHQNEIDEINEFINKKEFIIKCIDRFITKGRNSNKRINAILYGVVEDFIWIKQKDIYDILLAKKDEYSTSIHFSHLTYQPMNRCLNYNSKYEKSRFISQIKWYNISDDIIENMNNNVIKMPSQADTGELI